MIIAILSKILLFIFFVCLLYVINYLYDFFMYVYYYMVNTDTLGSYKPKLDIWILLSLSYIITAVISGFRI